MIILGIDPGSRITGYGFLKKQGSKLIHIDNGAIFAPAKQPLEIRLKKIFEDLNQLIGKYQPDVAAIENIFHAKNVNSALKLGHARGVALLASAMHHLPLSEYTPLQVKQAVVGYGRASKDQVQQMVKMLLGLPQPAEENASDALAVGICHGHSC